MDTQQIECFCAVVEEGSFNKAADRLYYSQSVVTKRIGELEEEFHIKLFNRGKGNKTELTTQGQEFLLLANNWLEQYENAKVISSTPNITTVSIVGVVSINEILSPLYIDIINNQKSIHLHLINKAEGEIYNVLSAKDADIGIVWLTSNPKKYDYIRIVNDSMCVVSQSKNNLPKSVSQSDLERCNEVYVNWSDEYEIWHNENWNESVKPLITINNSNNPVNYLSLNKSWLICPVFMANHLIERNPSLSIYYLDFYSPTYTLYLVINKFLPSHKRKAVQFVVQALEAYLKVHNK